MVLLQKPLALLLLAALFVPMERLWPIRRQLVLRPGWRLDVVHFFFTHLLEQLALVICLGLVLTVVTPPERGFVSHWSTGAQVLGSIFGLELIGYAMHRAFHEVPWLWRIHAVHHSSAQLDWLASVRVHPLDQALTRTVQVVVLSALGFDLTLLSGGVLFIGLWALLLHANVRVRFGWLERVVGTPFWHHWHHAAGARGNYSGLLPFIDRVCGTAITAHEWPSAYGDKKAAHEEGQKPRPTFVRYVQQLLLDEER